MQLYTYNYVCGLKEYCLTVFWVEPSGGKIRLMSPCSTWLY